MLELFEKKKFGICCPCHLYGLDGNVFDFDFDFDVLRRLCFFDT